MEETRRWPTALLVRPLENILVDDTRLGFSPAVVTALDKAGIVSFARLVWWMEQPGSLAKIPRVGKPTAGELSEFVRAFLEARDDHENRELGGEG